MAQDLHKLDAIEAAWRDWLSSARVGDSALAVSYDGVLVRAVGRGMDPAEPAPLASLSKAITAACLLDLEREGEISLDDPISTFWDREDDGTVGDVMTHSAGLYPDRTQQSMWEWVNDPVNRHAEAAERGLSAPAREVGLYQYNNENYAVLGHLIEQRTGQLYQDVCAERVLAPLDITSARRSARYGAFLPWGGWEMSVTDYLRFANATFGPQSAYARDVADRPLADVGQGIQYGAGVLYFAAEGQSFFWHFGLLCFGEIDGAGAYFSLYGDTYGLAVTFEGCPGEAALGALDQVLARAVLR